MNFKIKQNVFVYFVACLVGSFIYGGIADASLLSIGHNYVRNNGSTLASPWDFWKQSFLVPASTTNIARVDLGFNTGGSAVNMYIVSGAGNNSPILYTGHATGSRCEGYSSTTICNMTQFVLPTPLTVTPNTTYYIVADAPVGYLDTWAMYNAGSVYPDGNAIIGGTASPNVDYVFEVWTETNTAPPACTSWTYSAWSACTASSTQTRTISTSSPAGCTGGAPILTQSCIFTAGFNVIDIDMLSTPIFSLIITFISLIFTQLWPFVLVVVVVAGFAFSLNKFLHRIINKHE